MSSLRLALPSLLALVIIAKLCQGETVEDSSDGQLISPVIENIQELDRQIRSSFTKKENNNKAKLRREKRRKRKEIKRKGTQNKRNGRNKKTKGNNNNSKRKRLQKKGGKRKSRKLKDSQNKSKIKRKTRKLKENKNNSNTKSISKKERRRKIRKMKRKKNNSKRKSKSKKGVQRISKKEKKVKNARRKNENYKRKNAEENCDENCECGEICLRSKNFERQILRLNKRSNIIKTREEKSQNFRVLAEGITSKCEANSNTSYYNTTLMGCAATISEICKAPEIPGDLIDNGFCFNEIKTFKDESCKSNDTNPCSLTLADWTTFVKTNPGCKPTKLDKEMSGTLKNCSKYGVKPCKIVDFDALQYLVNCEPELPVTPAPSNITTSEPTPTPVTTPSPILPGENQVKKTVVVENGQIIEQTDSYNPDTKEVSISVPDHGDFKEATIIMDADSGTLVKSTPDACQIKPIPDDVDPNDIKSKVDVESNTTEPITEEMEKKTYTLVFDAGPATADDISKLSPTMVKECANKTILKTEEKKVDKETFDKFANGKVITVELGKQERQENTGCSNPAKVCAAKKENGCWRWTYGHLDSLHSISGDGFCVPCCNSTSNTGDLCLCTDLTSFEKIEECLGSVGPNGTCPEGFINVCGKCYADLSNKQIPACNSSCPSDRVLCGGECWPTKFENNLLVCYSTGKCHWPYPHPPCEGHTGNLSISVERNGDSTCLRENSFLCGDECWPDWYKNWKWVCNGKCLSKYTPCDQTLCPEGWFLCGSKCVRNQNKNYYQFCDGKCILASKPCNGKCEDNRVLCGNERCIKKTSSYWRSCGNKCIGQWTPCNGTCPAGRTLCGTDTCIRTGSTYRRTCGDRCLWYRQPCNGKCLDGLTLCNMYGEDYCYNPQYIWDCNGKCQYKSYPCAGKCPYGYVNCNGWCRDAYYYKQCNGQCIYSRDNCIDKCQVGNTVLQVGETLEYPEKCMMLNCTLKYSNWWQQSAVLESGNMGSPVTGVQIAGCGKCDYNGIWSTPKGKLLFVGSTSTGSCSVASTKKFRMRNVIRKKMISLSRK